jgi:pimeloyl-ACP methyl ester carboxylesterase
VAPDWPGFGRSEPPWTAPTYDNEVDRIERFVQRLGWQRFNLCAHDYGGFVGLGYVIRHPERVLRLAMLNTRAHGIHHIALARYRNIGCFDTALEAEYLGWMNTSQGRRTFWRILRALSGRRRPLADGATCGNSMPRRSDLGRPRSLYTVRHGTRTN